MLRGAREFLARLTRIETQTSRAVLSALYTAGNEIEVFAENSITSGSVSGRFHVPSLPGQPPNADTRLLDTNIETTIHRRQPPQVNVTSRAPYASYLEFGTSKMAERPYMRPAARRHEGRVDELVRGAIAAVARRR